MFVRVCDDYSDVIMALRDRAVALQIKRADIDQLAGLATGHAGKLLSPRPTKGLGPTSWGPTLEALGLRLILVEDTAATARTVGRRVPVDTRQQRFCHKNFAKPAIGA